MYSNLVRVKPGGITVLLFTIMPRGITVLLFTIMPGGIIIVLAIYFVGQLHRESMQCPKVLQNDLVSSFETGGFHVDHSPLNVSQVMVDENI